MDFMPAMSLYGIVRAQARDFGFTSSSDIAVEADFMQASENYLTGNNVTVYAFTTIEFTCISGGYIIIICYFRSVYIVCTSVKKRQYKWIRHFQNSKAVVLYSKTDL